MPPDPQRSPPPAEQEVIESSEPPRAKDWKSPTNDLAKQEDPAGVANLMNSMSLDQPLTATEIGNLQSMISDQLQQVEVIKDEHLDSIEKLKERLASELERIRRHSPDNGVQEFFNFEKDLELVDAEKVLKGLKVRNNGPG